MFVRLPNGTVNKVTKIVPIIEKFIVFNGKKRFLSEAISCDNICEKPNGVKLYFTEVVSGYNSNMFGNPETGVTIGNLKEEEVELISKSLLENGSFDLAGYEFQKFDMNYMNYVIDNGKSNPYFSNSVAFVGMASGLGYALSAVPSENNLIIDDDEVDELADSENWIDDDEDDYDFVTDED